MRFIFLFFITFIGFGFANPLTTSNSIEQEIQNSLDYRLYGKNKSIVSNLYARNGYQPLWVGANNRHKLAQLLDALSNPLFNYKEKDLGQNTLKKLFYKLDNNQIRPSKQVAAYGRLDVALTDSFVSLVRFIVEGDVDWNLVQRKIASLKESSDIKSAWEMNPKSFPDQNTMANAVISGDIRGYLESLLPLEKRYKELVQLLNKYRLMPQLPEIPYAHEDLKIGDKSPRVTQVKQLLQMLGDYPKGLAINDIYDVTTANAVARYQQRYNIEKTGKVDKITNYYMNQPLDKHLQSIATNLDKTKLYPKSFEEEHVIVNIPHYRLDYIYQDRNLFHSKLVLGRIDRPTPLFNDKIQYLVINPTWTIPDSLIKRDLIGVLRENPNYLKENNIKAFSGNNEVQVTARDLAPYEHSQRNVPYRFVQYPGDNNALGRVKFMFPNRYAVYLHDTDNKDLFNRRYRVYSSGCVRVENPFEFTNILLRNNSDSYPPERIEQILSTNEPTTVRLTKHIPVHLLYFTVHKRDAMAFFDYDIYMYDQIIFESTQGNYKQTFKVPEKRMISVEKNAREDTSAAP